MVSMMRSHETKSTALCLLSFSLSLSRQAQRRREKSGIMGTNFRSLNRDFKNQRSKMNHCRFASFRLAYDIFLILLNKFSS